MSELIIPVIDQEPIDVIERHLQDPGDERAFQRLATAAVSGYLMFMDRAPDVAEFEMQLGHEMNVLAADLRENKLGHRWGWEAIADRTESLWRDVVGSADFHRLWSDIESARPGYRSVDAEYGVDLRDMLEKYAEWANLPRETKRDKSFRERVETRSTTNNRLVHALSRGRVSPQYEARADAWIEDTYGSREGLSEAVTESIVPALQVVERSYEVEDPNLRGHTLIERRIHRIATSYKNLTGGSNMPMQEYLYRLARGLDVGDIDFMDEVFRTDNPREAYLGYVASASDLTLERA